MLYFDSSTDKYNFRPADARPNEYSSGRACRTGILGEATKIIECFMPDQIDYIDFTKKIVLRHLPKNEYKVFLFGSRAVGNAKPKSDIDNRYWGETSFIFKNKNSH